MKEKKKVKVPYTEVIERREKLKRQWLSGITSPTLLLQNPYLAPYYSKYPNPIEIVKSDLRAVRKELRQEYDDRDLEGLRREYIAKLEHALSLAWNAFARLEGTAQVGMLNTILEILKRIAQAQGVELSKVVDAQFIKAEISGLSEEDRQMLKDIAYEFLKRRSYNDQ